MESVVTAKARESGRCPAADITLPTSEPYCCTTLQCLTTASLFVPHLAHAPVTWTHFTAGADTGR